MKWLRFVAFRCVFASAGLRRPKFVQLKIYPDAAAADYGLA
jgi:hypothetical protein